MEWNKLLEMVDVGFELVSGGVDSASHSAVEVLRSAPEPELETVDSLDHLRKIEDSIQSST